MRSLVDWFGPGVVFTEAALIAGSAGLRVASCLTGEDAVVVGAGAGLAIATFFAQLSTKTAPQQISPMQIVRPKTIEFMESPGWGLCP